ncbi:MAG: hypothetical protein ACH34Y_05290 [Brachymonas sp.]|jgi:hypothetical protein
MPLSRFSFALAVLCASSYASTAAAAPTLYKCVTNGQVTYANEPCKGQSMQVVKGGDANMVQVNSQKNMAPNDPSGADVPVVKLEPKTDTSTGPAASLGLGQAAPAAQNPATQPGNTNERFIAQLQQQTQALAQQAAQTPAASQALAPADWPQETASNSAATVQLPAGFEPLRMPTGEEIVAELRKSWQTELLPQLRSWLAYGLLLLLVSSLLALFALYWVMRLAVKHGILAAKNAPAKRVQLPPMAAASMPAAISPVDIKS